MKTRFGIKVHLTDIYEGNFLMALRRVEYIVNYDEYLLYPNGRRKLVQNPGIPGSGYTFDSLVPSGNLGRTGAPQA